MINFMKSSGHYGKKDVKVVSITTEGKTLGELNEAYASFLLSLGFEVDEPKPNPTLDEDFYI
tara:strand:+ start:126 stop:311 length:186 start_codon:yes stop_codon:yes gene_type:complete